MCAAAAAPFPDKAATPGEHLRNIFYRMGLNDQEIVALSGALHNPVVRLTRTVMCGLFSAQWAYEMKIRTAASSTAPQ
jgi:Peroxidase